MLHGDSQSGARRNGDKRTPSKAGSSTVAIASVMIALLAACMGYLLHLTSAVPVGQTASFVTVADGRNISYLRHGGAPARTNILLLHDSASSRLSALQWDPQVLQQLSMQVIAPDRPGYGESSPHHASNLTTFVGDMERLVSTLGAGRVIVAASGSAASYALALAAEAPHCVMALLLLAPAVSSADLLPEDAKDLEGCAVFPGKTTFLESLLVNAAASASSGALLRRFANARRGGRLMWHMVLRGRSGNTTTHLEPEDAACLSKSHPEALTASAEGLRRKSATGWAADVSAVARPLPYNLTTAIAPDLQRRIFIVASVNDTMQPAMFANSLKRRLPEATMEHVTGGGHSAWWACDADMQTRQLSRLLAAGCADSPTEAASCPGWAQSGECSNKREFMLKRCPRSCGVCHYTPSDIEQASLQPCADKNDQCAGWASDGECPKNSEFMYSNCPKSCMTCHFLHTQT